MALSWIAVVAGAVVAGAALVGVLVAKPLLEPALALLSLGSLGVSVYGLARIAASYQTDEAALWAFAFIVAAAGGGYALASTLLHLLAGRRAVPVLPAETPQDPGSPAVLVVACTEPETYEAGATARMLLGLANQGLLAASIGFLPFLFFAQKTRYRAVGGRNPAIRQLATVAEKLGTTLRETKVQATLCTGPESLAAHVVEAVRAGHRSVVVAPLSVGESLLMNAANQTLRDLQVGGRGITVVNTGVLSCSERITGMLAARILNSVGDSDTTGVVLVGHGQPDVIAERNPQMDEDETVFLSRLRVALTDAGLSDAHVSIAWADWGEPDVTVSIRHLVALGCTRVVVAPATYPLDTIATRIDLEVAIRQARVDDAATITTLPAWRDDAAVIEELRSRVSAALVDPNA